MFSDKDDSVLEKDYLVLCFHIKLFPLHEQTVGVGGCRLQVFYFVRLNIPPSIHYSSLLLPALLQDRGSVESIPAYLSADFGFTCC